MFTLLLLIAAAVISDSATAQAPHSGKHRGQRFSSGLKVCPSLGCCPDDYCRKPMPSICPLPGCGSCDDYCRKPSPCITNLPYAGCCDDYCRKTTPTLLCPPCSPYLQCFPFCR